MTRAEWLASLQTFDKVWVPEGVSGPGRILEVVRLGDGRLIQRGVHASFTEDLREPWADGTCIQPVPEAPWGRCSRCTRPHDNPWRDADVDGLCLRCWWDDHPRACVGGCRTREEHESEVHAQRVRCGLALKDGESAH